MPNYFQVGPDTWIEFNPTTYTSRVISKPQLQDQISSLQMELDSNPEWTDEALLGWARQQIFILDRLQLRQQIQDKIAEVQATLEKLV